MTRISVFIFALSAAAVLGLATPSFADGPHSRSGGGIPVATAANGFEEVPAILSKGNAAFFAAVNEGAQTISFKLNFNNLSTNATSATINFAQRGVNGGVVVFLCGGAAAACPSGTSGTLTGTITASDVVAVTDQGVAAGSFQDLIDVIASGNGYLNVSTADFPNGEVRGQIVP
ncbi:MAG TPA: CHRD domain-containing protein [Blastocatellia bacterium]